MAKLFTTAEAAKFLGVSVKTLRRWKKSGVLVPEKMGHKGRGKWDIYSREQLIGIKNGTRAKFLGVSVKTLRRWKKSGVLVPEKMGHKVAENGTFIRANSLSVSKMGHVQSW